MEIKGIKYIGPIWDNSGYARAARQNILALNSLGMPLTLGPISFEGARPDLGDDFDVLRALDGKEIDYNIVLMHCTPEFYQELREPNKFNCGYTIWETTKLHPSWPEYINNNVDALFVGCEWNVNVFKESGVTVPVFNAPHCISFDALKEAKPYKVSGVGNDTFMFYSVFQWTERKSPLDLIKAYWQAFPNNENVALVLKTYRSDYSEGERNAIRTTIKRLKQVCKADNFPPLYLILDMLSEDEINGLHKRGDCYASLDRGEGFGLSPFQAAAMGNPIIITGFGGATEYAKPDNSYLVDYVEIPVWGMPWSPWYRLEQNWAQASVAHGVEFMRHVYNDKEEAKSRGLKLQKFIHEEFTWDKLGNRILNNLESL
jgi:glycosyltransferase involved in cell wall biosynthesis